ncbi:hypothetical protein ACFE04_026042 [Oxalis oulophora]
MPATLHMTLTSTTSQDSAADKLEEAPLLFELISRVKQKVHGVTTTVTEETNFVYRTEKYNTHVLPDKTLKWSFKFHSRSEEDHTANSCSLEPQRGFSMLFPYEHISKLTSWIMDFAKEEYKNGKHDGLVVFANLVVKKFPKVVHNKDKDDDLDRCSICLQEFEEGDVQELVKTPCCHIFHGRCIIHWFVAHNSCPLCRHEAFQYTLLFDVPPECSMRASIQTSVSKYAYDSSHMNLAAAGSKDSAADKQEQPPPTRRSKVVLNSFPKARRTTRLIVAP